MAIITWIVVLGVIGNAYGSLESDCPIQNIPQCGDSTAPCWMGEGKWSCCPLPGTGTRALSFCSSASMECIRNLLPYPAEEGGYYTGPLDLVAALVVLLGITVMQRIVVQSFMQPIAGWVFGRKDLPLSMVHQWGAMVYMFVFHVLVAFWGFYLIFSQNMVPINVDHLFTGWPLEQRTFSASTKLYCIIQMAFCAQALVVTWVEGGKKKKKRRSNQRISPYVLDMTHHILTTICIVSLYLFNMRNLLVVSTLIRYFTSIFLFLWHSVRMMGKEVIERWLFLVFVVVFFIARLLVWPFVIFQSIRWIRKTPYQWDPAQGAYHTFGVDFLCLGSAIGLAPVDILWLQRQVEILRKKFAGETEGSEPMKSTVMPGSGERMPGKGKHEMLARVGVLPVLERKQVLKKELIQMVRQMQPDWDEDENANLIALGVDAGVLRKAVQKELGVVLPRMTLKDTTITRLCTYVYKAASLDVASGW